MLKCQEFLAIFIKYLSALRNISNLYRKRKFLYSVNVHMPKNGATVKCRPVYGYHLFSCNKLLSEFLDVLYLSGYLGNISYVYLAV